MLASRSRHKSVFRVIAIWIAMAFFCSFTPDLAWVEVGNNSLLTGSDRGGGFRPGLLKNSLGSVELPLSIGYIREIHEGESDKPVVIYLQDAHCNYSCQKSISNIIEFFNEKYGVNAAAVEGGSGKYDFSIFTSIPDMEIREKVCDYFVREGRVTGVEFFAIMNPGKLMVRGLESPDLYEKNLTVYRESLSYQDRVEKYLNILRHYMENLKPPIFSKDMKQFDTKKKAYDDNTEELKDYIIYLNEVSRGKAIPMDMFQNLDKLLELIESETHIDFDRAQKEREIAVDELTRKLSKAEIGTLVQKSIDFKQENMTSADFYGYLFKKLDSCDIILDDFPELVKYKTYLDQYDAVEKDVFFEEMFNIERHIANNIFSNDDERNLYYLADDLTILNKLFSVSLTRQQYDYFTKKKEDLSVNKYVDFIHDKASWYNITASINPEVVQIDMYKEKITQFYEYSFKRDDVFIENLEKYAEGNDAMFMVTGGFHTDNMMELLKEKGYPFILITPKLEQEKYNPYFKLLAGNLSPIETVLSEYTSALALRSAFSQMALTGDSRTLGDAAFGMAQLLREVKESGTRDKGILLNMPGPDGQVVNILLTFAKPSALQVSEGRARSLDSFDGEEFFAIKLTAAEAAQAKTTALGPYDVTSENMEKTMKMWKEEEAEADVIKRGSDVVEGGAGGLFPGQGGFGGRPPDEVTVRTQPDVVPENEAERFVLRQIEARTEPATATRPGFKIGIIVEENREDPRMFVGPQAQNFESDFEKLARDYVKALVNYDGTATVDMSGSRDETERKMKQMVEDGVQPVVFALQDFGPAGTEFERLKIPVLSLRMPDKVHDTPTNMKQRMENAVVVDPVTVVQMAITAAELKTELIRDVRDAERIKPLFRYFAALRAALEDSDEIKDLPDDLAAVLFNGGLDILLPAITKFDVNTIETVYEAIRKLETAL